MRKPKGYTAYLQSGEIIQSKYFTPISRAIRRTGSVNPVTQLYEGTDELDFNLLYDVTYGPVLSKGSLSAQQFRSFKDALSTGGTTLELIPENRSYLVGDRTE